MSRCDGLKHELGRHQKAVVAITRVLCGPSFRDRNRGVLIWHSTGSGKTCSAVSAFEAVWDSARPLIYVSSVEGLAANPPEKFHECARLLPRFKNVPDVAAAFDARGVEYLSFAQLAHLLQLHRPRKASSASERLAMERHVAGALVVIDEVHGLIAPAPGHGKECAALLHFLQTADDERTEGAKVLLLTATPGDNVRDILALLNVVRTPGTPEVAWPTPDPRRSLHALVSFFDYSADTSRYPRVLQTDHQVYMSVEQALELTHRARDRDPFKDAPEDRDDLRTVWSVARRYSNALFQRPKDMPLAEYSPKIAAVLDAIAAHPQEKHLVYSVFSSAYGYGGQGAQAVVRSLVDAAGYEASKGKAPLRPKKRVALLSRGQPIQQIVRAFNAEDNAHGQRLQVLVATQGFNESIDLKGVRHVHVLEPLVSAEDQKQLVGRGVRMCSHSQLSHPDEWTVTVHTYESVPPDLALEAAAATAEVAAVSKIAAAIAGEIDALKGARGWPALRMRREQLKKHLVIVNRELKSATGELKRVKEASHAPSVDSTVLEFARKRGRDVEGLLQALRDNAIDCKLFQKFHESGGIAVDCTA